MQQVPQAAMAPTAPPDATAFAQYCRQRQQAEVLAGLVTRAPREIVVPICLAALDHLSAGMPEADTAFGDLRADARFWASVATPQELREYVAAACRQMVEDRADMTMAEGPRKVLFVALWDSLSERERKRFLSRVDPKGIFRAGRA